MERRRPGNARRFGQMVHSCLSGSTHERWYKPNGFAKMSKRELIQEVTSVKAENEAMKAEMVEMKAMLQKLLGEN